MNEDRAPRENKRLNSESRNYTFNYEDKLGKFTHGNTVVYAKVNLIEYPSPRNINYEENLASLDVRYTMCPFSTATRFTGRPYSNRRSIEISKVIKAVFMSSVSLEEFPKKQIYGITEVIAADGGTRCAAINALSLSLIKSDLPYKDIPLAISFGKDKFENIILDLDYEEDSSGLADVPVVINSYSGDINFIQMEGDLSFEEFKLGITYATDELKKMKKVLLKQ